MLRQFFISFSALAISKSFILRHRLWENWESMRWLYASVLVGAFLVGLRLLRVLGAAVRNVTSMFQGDFDRVEMGMGFNWFSLESFSSSSSYKYLFLLLTMSLVYHFGGRAIEIIYGIPYRPSFKGFIRSQTRTAIVVLLCLIIEKIVTGILSGILNLSHGGFLLGLATFLIHSFLFGAVIIDGLHEVRGATMNQGIKHSFNHYPGIALSMGAIGVIFSYVPLIGIIFVSSILTVAILIAIKRVDSLG
jgi:hypothetical protein